MKIENDAKKYLSGEEFSSGFKFSFSNKENKIPSRIEEILKIVKDKTIVHVGCVDHLELIEKKIKTNKWLHEILVMNTKRCLGIDINKKGIEYLENQLNYKEVVYANIIEDEIAEIKKNKWDFIFLGEILEHVDNPVLFLQAIKNKYQGIIDEIILTAPNAFAYNNFINLFMHTEHINSDHRYWFTPFTLAKVLGQANMTVKDIYICQRFPYRTKSLRIKKLLKRNLLKRIPGLRDTIIITARI